MRAILGNACLIFIAIGFSGCANRPESIHADFVSHERFMGLNCTALAQRHAESSAQLAQASQSQNDIATGDAFTVFLVGVPVSKLSGDREAEVARLKGEIEAIETAQVKTKCRAA